MAAVIPAEGRQCDFMRPVDGFDTGMFGRICSDASPRRARPRVDRWQVRFSDR